MNGRGVVRTPGQIKLETELPGLTGCWHRPNETNCRGTLGQVDRAVCETRRPAAPRYTSDEHDEKGSR